MWPLGEVRLRLHIEITWLAGKGNNPISRLPYIYPFRTKSNNRYKSINKFINMYVNVCMFIYL